MLFLSDPRVPAYPYSGYSGGGLLYTFCVWHLGARAIYYSVCHMLKIDAVFFARVWCLRSLCVCQELIAAT